MIKKHFVAVIFLLAFAQESVSDETDLTKSIEIVVTDYSYYVNGTRTESLELIRDIIKDASSAAFSVVLCEKTDNSKLLEVIEILRENTKKEIKVSNSFNYERQECGEAI